MYCFPSTALLGLLALCTSYAFAQNSTSTGRRPLSYAPLPDDVYVAPKRTGTATLLEFIESRPELSSLLAALKEPSGFTQAFDTEPSWQFTFFAPSNTAFENTGEYFSTFETTAKGKWWIGNLLTHHYVPNSMLNSSLFNSTTTRIESGNYNFISAQVIDGSLTLNNASHVTEADLPVTSGIVHIIDHILDPSAQIYNRDLPRISQAFIPGSCANPELSYC